MSLTQKAKDKKKNQQVRISSLTNELSQAKYDIEALRKEVIRLQEIESKYSICLDQNIRLANKVEDLEDALRELAE